MWGSAVSGLMSKLVRPAALFAMTMMGAGVAAPVFAADPEAGARSFARQCTSCHVLRDDGGRMLVGTGARTGPNLFGLARRPAGTAEGFVYSTAMQQLAARTMLWDEPSFVAFVTGPGPFLQQRLSDRRANSRMAFVVSNPADAADLWAYLSGLGN